MVWVTVNDIEFTALQSLQNDSDRAVAIVAASLVETRLEEAILSYLQRDDKIVQDLFRSSGPLGSFSAKIRIAYLMGITSKVLMHELERMKNIRNKFAHNLSAMSFDETAIADQCKNLKIIDDVCREPDDMERAGKHNTRLAVPDCEKKLKFPRQRYLLSAAIFTSALWHSSRRSTTPITPSPYM